MPFFNRFFTDIALFLGVPPDHIRLITLLLLNYPLAVLYKGLPQNPNIKHIFSITYAVICFLGIYDLGKGFYTLLACALVCYAITYFVKGKWMPGLVFLVAMGHMCVNHIFRQINRVSLDEFDITGPQMVLVIKLTSFAFSVFDGQRSIEESKTSHQQKCRIVQFPSVLEYLGYCFFFTGFLVGPAFEFMDYRNFTTMKMFVVDQKEKDLNGVQRSENQKYYIPNSIIPGLKTLAFAMIWVVGSLLFAHKFTMEWTLTVEYENYPFLYRFLYIQISAFVARFKFYVVWLFAEGACIMTGIGFNGFDEHGNAKWDRVRNIDVVAYETADNEKVVLESWNMKTNQWLKNYVYRRVTPPDHKPTFFSTFATFGVSAMWHGFYPGYYLTFASGAIVQNTHKVLRQKLRPLFLVPPLAAYKPGYDFVGWITTQFTINYIIIPFLILSFNDSIYVWRLNYFCVHIGLIMIQVWGLFVRRKKEKVVESVVVPETGFPFHNFLIYENLFFLFYINIYFFWYIYITFVRSSLDSCVVFKLKNDNTKLLEKVGVFS